MKTKVIKVHPQFPDLRDIAQCAKVIRDGGLVIFPTETVYGIGANFRDEAAMKRLREVKRRKDDKPFSLLISQKELISNYTSSPDNAIYKLIDAYWPGPMTIIVPGKDPDTTVGIRMPDNEIALRLVRESHCAFAAPSANLEGKEPPRTCEAALEDLDGLVDVAIDGGEVEFGSGSTIVDVSDSDVKLLREGPISFEEIQKTVARKSILFVCTGNSCRSVMAEYFLKAKCEGRKDVDISSAGTGVFVQSTASAETLAVLSERGIDASRHYSRPVSTIALKKADLIFCMTRAHRDQILERVPEVENRLYLMREFTKIPADFQGNLDISDPIGRSRAEYQDCAREIREAVDKIDELI